MILSGRIWYGLGLLGILALMACGVASAIFFAQANELKEVGRKRRFEQTEELPEAEATGKLLSIPNLTYRYFRPILEKAKLPQMRLYDLRHSCATLLLMAGENPKVVSERLGHSTIVLTLDTYSHVLPTMQENATTRLEKRLYRKGSVHASDPRVTQE